MEKGEGVAEEEVGKYLNDEGHEIELVALLEEFDEEENDGTHSVDGKG